MEGNKFPEIRFNFFLFFFYSAILKGWEKEGKTHCACCLRIYRRSLLRILRF